jgi:hypothetical protein
MAELKTRETKQPAEEFLATIQPKQKQTDGFTLLELFKEVTGEKPVMWGSSIIGFGKYHYKSERSTQEGDWPLVGFSPRKQNLTLYIIHDNTDSELLGKLGKYKKSVGCLYINKLADVDIKILSQLIEKSFQHMKKTTTTA